MLRKFCSYAACNSYEERRKYMKMKIYDASHVNACIRMFFLVNSYNSTNNVTVNVTPDLLPNVKTLVK